MAAAGTAGRKVWHWRGRSFMRMPVGTWVAGPILKSSVVPPPAWHCSTRTYRNQWMNRARAPSSSVVTADSHCSGLSGQTVVSSSPSQGCGGGGGVWGLVVGRCFQLKCISPYPRRRFVRERMDRPMWWACYVCVVFFVCFCSNPLAQSGF